VSFVLAGGPADISGELRRGDKLLSVNSVDFRGISHEQAVSVLKRCGSTADIVAQYAPEDYQRFETRLQVLQEQTMELSAGTLKTTQKRTLFVRALFNYDPTKDSGLPGRGLAFSRGDILHVTNASDDDWWQARRLEGIDDVADQMPGIIPSKSRVERRERARTRNVKFLGKDGESALSSTSSMGDKKNKKKHFFGKKLRLTKPKERSKSENALDVDQITAARSEEVVPSYEAVVRQELKCCRPVIILGPLKDRISDCLIAEFPDKFACCVPHTTRAPNEGEIDGREYHFVRSREQMERDIQNHLFIEAGQYNDNLYGTSIQAIRDIAETGRHCLLDVSGNAIKRLYSVGIFPISIFVRPRCIESIMDWSKRTTAEQARATFEHTLKLDQEFGANVTATISGETFEDVYAAAKHVIASQPRSYVWTPSKEKL
jgi:guanylate kinase